MLCVLNFTYFRDYIVMNSYCNNHSQSLVCENATLEIMLFTGATLLSSCFILRDDRDSYQIHQILWFKTLSQVEIQNNGHIMYVIYHCMAFICIKILFLNKNSLSTHKIFGSMIVYNMYYSSFNSNYLCLKKSMGLNEVLLVNAGVA